MPGAASVSDRLVREGVPGAGRAAAPDIAPVYPAPLEIWSTNKTWMTSSRLWELR
jgi:hypothetical protein